MYIENLFKLLNQCCHMPFMRKKVNNSKKDEQPRFSQQKTCHSIFLENILNDGFNQYVLCHVSAILDDDDDSPGHQASKGSQVVIAQVLGPQLQQGVLQLGQGGDVLLQLIFHLFPVVFSRS